MSIRIISSQPKPRLMFVFMITIQLVLFIMLFAIIFSIGVKNYNSGILLRERISQGVQTISDSKSSINDAYNTMPSLNMLTYWVKNNNQFIETYSSIITDTKVEDILACHGLNCENYLQQELMEVSYKNSTFIVMLPEDISDGNYFLVFTCENSKCIPLE